MAIQVNGTTVIDDNRNLVNIVSGAGSSTDIGAVGTYGIINTRDLQGDPGTTAAAGLHWTWSSIDNETARDYTPEMSGTWRRMCVDDGSRNARLLLVRIS